MARKHKLTKDQQEYARESYAAGAENYVTLSKKFNVSVSTIRWTINERPSQKNQKLWYGYAGQVHPSEERRAKLLKKEKLRSLEMKQACTKWLNDRGLNDIDFNSYSNTEHTEIL